MTDWPPGPTAGSGRDSAPREDADHDDGFEAAFRRTDHEVRRGADVELGGQLVARARRRDSTRGGSEPARARVYTSTTSSPGSRRPIAWAMCGPSMPGPSSVADDWLYCQRRPRK